MTAKAEPMAVRRSIPWARIFLWIFALVGAFAAGYRLLHGLGAATNLSDGRPWGLWISFDVLCGVALAAGGFTIGAIVKIFHIKRFYPILRPTALTAFLGYVMAAGSIVFDIGLPWRIWHPIVYHNWHSPMLEVALCVMTYLTVLALEVSDVFFEGMQWKSIKRIIEGLMIPLVILGITLSTMHQSSLGTLYVLASRRVFALWKTGYLPLLFFTSAVAAGLTMTIIESNFAISAYGLKDEQDILAELGLYAAWVLLIYTK
jgi:Ni/Fe-hydrogenase subunit HybB-like protein